MHRVRDVVAFDRDKAPGTEQQAVDLSADVPIPAQQRPAVVEHRT